MKGIVLRSTGSFYDVLTEDGKKYNCRMRGKIRLEEIKETNPVAVGDKVIIDLEHEIGSIVEILPRENHILRQSIKKTGHAHVLAANVDQALVVVTLTQPRTSIGFIDRFLITAEAYRIPQIIIFNKKDLLSEKELNKQKELIHLYESIGVKCFSISALHDSPDEIKKSLQNKITLVMGHSGVGKSTLLNMISPKIKQAVGDISDFSNKGTHTTTFAEMFPLNSNTFVIDTPGVKEWGLVDMNQQELSDYFPEMRELRLNCKFGARCLHMNEPGCEVIKSVKEHKIAASRYESYISMALGDDNRK